MQKLCFLPKLKAAPQTDNFTKRSKCVDKLLVEAKSRRAKSVSSYKESSQVKTSYSSLIKPVH